jgi:hypothetical protein
MFCNDCFEPVVTIPVSRYQRDLRSARSGGCAIRFRPSRSTVMSKAKRSGPVFKTTHAVHAAWNSCRSCVLPDSEKKYGIGEKKKKLELETRREEFQPSRHMRF